MPRTTETRKTRGSKVHPVILSGGVGTRLWPLSRANLPKQLLPLVGEETLLQATVRRFVDRTRFHAPMIIANDDHRFVIAEQLRQMAIDDAAIVLEPVGRNTAPAAAAAALILAEEDPEAVMMVLPSDHMIGDSAAFRTCLDHAAQAAAAGHLLTFGVVPDRPSTEYGYIRRGDALGGEAEAAHAVDRFVEKPDTKTAAAFVAAGDYLWNSGMFLFAVGAFLDEFAALQPEMLAACRRAVAARRRDLDFIRLDADAFAAAPGNSIDYAVMEKTGRAAVVPARFGWSDVGAWDALWRLADKDAQGNVLIGDVTAVDVQDSYIRSEGDLTVAALGLRETCVVATCDSLFVAPLDRASEVKALVEAFNAEGRQTAVSHPRVLRPWGSFTDIERGARFKVKRLVVKPGARLSLQKHAHRSEHWVVVEGRATVVNGDQSLELDRDQSTYITAGTAHRLENRTETDLHLIEVQVGDYLEEDDIVRLDDDYRRD